jgi:hypothetical protein
MNRADRRAAGAEPQPKTVVGARIMLLKEHAATVRQVTSLRVVK